MLAPIKIDIVALLGKPGESRVTGQAAILGEMIVSEQKLRMDAARRYLELADLQNAAEQIRELLARRPQPNVEENALELKARILEKGQATVTMALEKYRDGAASEDVARAAINLYRSPRPFTFLSLALAVLMAALNMPIGIALGLAGERVTRPKNLRPPPKGPPKKRG